MLYFARILFWQIYSPSEAVLTVDINRKKGFVEQSHGQKSHKANSVHLRDRRTVLGYGFP